MIKYKVDSKCGNNNNNTKNENQNKIKNKSKNKNKVFSNILLRNSLIKSNSNLNSNFAKGYLNSSYEYNEKTCEKSNGTYFDNMISKMKLKCDERNINIKNTNLICMPTQSKLRQIFSDDSPRKDVQKYNVISFDQELRKQLKNNISQKLTQDNQVQ